MTYAIPVHVALIDETGQIAAADLQECAGALNEQVQADFAPVWKVAATVGVYSSKSGGTWQIQIQTQLDQPGALGYHTDSSNQPISYIEFTDSWRQTCSHELLEMLADPWGNRMHAARLPDALASDYAQFGLPHQYTRVHYLLEVCDPCEDTSYEVGGLALSDFLLPAWYRTAPIASNAYTHAGGCTSAREVADGGYVSFSNASGEWFQAFNQSGSLQVQDLGQFNDDEHGSLREFADTKAREHRAAHAGT